MDSDADAVAAGVALGGLGSIGVAAALVGVRGEVSNANVALLLVACVLIGALTGGRVAGAASAVVAAMSFDFFHTLPYNSLKISNADDVQTTVILLLIGVVAGELGAWARRGRVALREDRDGIRRIHRVAEAVARGDGPDDVILSVVAETSVTLSLRTCDFDPTPGDGARPALQHDGRVLGGRHLYARGGVELPPEGVELAVVGRGRTLGRLVLVPNPGVVLSLEQRMTAIALADQLGQVLAAER